MLKEHKNRVVEAALVIVFRENEHVYAATHQFGFRALKVLQRF